LLITLRQIFCEKADFEEIPFQSTLRWRDVSRKVKSVYRGHLTLKGLQNG
jgi:hypothetical protein